MINKIKSNPMLIAVILAVIIVTGSLAYINRDKIEKLFPKNISDQQAAEKAVNYINQNILQGKGTAVLTNVVSEDGLYKFHLKIGTQEFDSYITKNGKIFFPDFIELEKVVATTPEPDAEKTIGSFSVSEDAVCNEAGKPIVYFFGTSTCPHCQWEKPILEGVMAKFKDSVVFNENIDTEKDIEIFNKYNPSGTVPTLVFGCKYYRVGSGETIGEEQEAKVLTALSCKLTGNQPGEVCDGVKDLIAQIQ